LDQWNQWIALATEWIGKAKNFPIFMRMSEERCGSEEGV
jgi:hypothetical protein